MFKKPLPPISQREEANKHPAGGTCSAVKKEYSVQDASISAVFKWKPSEDILTPNGYHIYVSNLRYEYLFHPNPWSFQIHPQHHVTTTPPYNSRKERTYARISPTLPVYHRSKFPLCSRKSNFRALQPVGDLYGSLIFLSTFMIDMLQQPLFVFEVWFCQRGLEWCVGAAAASEGQFQPPRG